MTQTDPLRDVFGGSTPYQCILEALLQVAMDSITHVFDSRVPADDESLAEIRINALSV